MMLSRVLKDAAPGVQPAVWNRTISAPHKPKRHSEHKLEAPEVEQLRETVAELAADVEQRSRQSYETGFRAGDAAARKDLEAEIQTAVEKLSATIVDVAATRAETIRRAEADTVRLAIEIARRVLHRELTVDESALEAIVKAALEKLQSQEIYRVRVHPDHENLVRNCLTQAGRGQAIEVVGDPLQTKGGALFEISRGALDASLDTQLREIECGLIDQLEMRA